MGSKKIYDEGSAFMSDVGASRQSDPTEYGRELALVLVSGG